MFGPNFPYLVDILPLREGHLCPSSISCQSADSFLEEEGGTEEYTCPDYCQGAKGRATVVARTETVSFGQSLLGFTDKSSGTSVTSDRGYR